MPNVLTEQQAQALCERALRSIAADAAQVRVTSREAGHLRVAANQITTGGVFTDVELVLTARVGAREASVRLNQTEPERLADAARQVVRAARVAPEDPELMPLPGDGPAPEVLAEFDATASLDAATRIQAANVLIERAEAADMVGAGFVTHEVTSTAVANTAGLFRYHRSSIAALSTTMRTPDGRGSGWAGSTHNDWDRVAPIGTLADRAIGKAAGSVTTQPVEPGVYTVVFERAAIAPLIGIWVNALDARAAAEGRSAMARPDGRTPVGERLASGTVTIVSDPADPDVLARPFTDQGQPIGRTVWIEDGVLRNLSASRYWAQQQGIPPTPPGGGVRMSGTDQSVESLVAGVTRGLLVTRLWYIRMVDGRTLTYTGLTRDGTFRIEDGQVTGGAGNLRFNQSVVDMLQRVVAVGRSERTLATGSGDPGPAIVVPPLVVSQFRFTSASDAV
jgi:predicted Zn-dependent protease